MKIGVALGGGGVRGLAHVPALEAIDTHGIEPTALAGTSMGAIIAALYAAGRSGQQIHELLNRHIVTSADGFAEIYHKKRSLLKWFHAVRPAWKKSGLLKADGFLHYLLEEIHAETFEELKIPLQVVATDFYRGKPVIFNSGRLLPALRASISIPGIFVPVEHEGRILVDGGVTDNLPYDLLRPHCDVRIAIDVAPTWRPDQTEAPNIVDATVGMFDILVDQLVTLRLAVDPPTLYFHPELVNIRTLDFDKVETVLEQAEQSMSGFRTRLYELVPAS